MPPADSRSNTPAAVNDRENQHPENNNSTSYNAMSVGDVDAIGAHCQMTFCRQLDFLPFKCESCGGKFCLDHRSETAHSCPQAGAWARRRQQQQNQADGGSTASTARPSILTHEQQCADPSCKTLINTALTPGVHCDKCRRSYCLKHRFADEHNCAALTPLGSVPGGGVSQKERGRAALEKLRAWGAAKKASMMSTSTISGKSSSSSAAATRVRDLAALKRTAKGDEKVPLDKRVYLHVEASAETISAKIPRGDYFYHVDWSVGRVLDLAAKSLQVSNVNNRANSEEDRLRVFHIEGGRLLDFGQKLGAADISSGHTIVLLRGVGASMASTPDRT